MNIEKRLSINEINQYVIHNLEQTLTKFCGNTENKERKMPLEFKILKMEAENRKNDAYLTLSASKDKEGLLRFISVNVAKI